MPCGIVERAGLEPADRFAQHPAIGWPPSNRGPMGRANRSSAELRPELWNCQSGPTEPGNAPLARPEVKRDSPAGLRCPFAGRASSPRVFEVAPLLGAVRALVTRARTALLHSTPLPRAATLGVSWWERPPSSVTPPGLAAGPKPDAVCRSQRTFEALHGAHQCLYLKNQTMRHAMCQLDARHSPQR